MHKHDINAIPLDASSLSGGHINPSRMRGSSLKSSMEYRTPFQSRLAPWTGSDDDSQ